MTEIPVDFKEGTRAFDLKIESTEDAEPGEVGLLKPLTITVNYNANDLIVADGDPRLLTILHFRNDEWVTLETVLDIESSTLVAQVTELSPFLMTAFFDLAVAFAFQPAHFLDFDIANFPFLAEPIVPPSPDEGATALVDPIDDPTIDLPPNLRPVTDVPIPLPFVPPRGTRTAR